MTGSKQACSLLFFAIFAIFNISLNSMANSGVKDLSFEELVDSADYYSAHKRWEDAERATVNALRLKPANKTNWLLWSNLAEIRNNLHDTEGALTAYNVGLSLQPNSEKMLTGRAALFLQEKRFEDAISDLDHLLENDSTLEWPRMIRGMLMLDQGHTEKAEKDFIMLKRLYPENPQSYNGLATIKARNGDYEEAVKLYNSSLALSPDENIYFYKVLLLADHGKLPEASESLREAMKTYPRNGNLFLLRAYIHKLNFQNDEAEIALKLAKEYGADT
ncbi:MAG: tetratricopeptide repeat protein, partial [Muribaculaceae bacterium]|nr:tetratricopeptide repeat protein [Muribaculaceae bacterium]